MDDRPEVRLERTFMCEHPVQEGTTIPTRDTAHVVRQVVVDGSSLHGVQGWLSMPTSPDVLDLYDQVIATQPDVRRKGAKTPYTSVNGHMFSFRHAGREHGAVTP